MAYIIKNSTTYYTVPHVEGKSAPDQRFSLQKLVCKRGFILKPKLTRKLKYQKFPII